MTHKRFLTSTLGAASIEYAMIAAFLSVLIVGGTVLISRNLGSAYDTIAAEVR